MEQLKVKVEDFDIKQTLECGQCFHYYNIAPNEYVIVAYHRLLHVKQKADELILFNTTQEDYTSLWRRYFDLDTDYKKIKEYLIKNDSTLKGIIAQNAGLRILRQEFSETIMSFIISQNKQIPHIKKIVNDISREYGDLLGSIDGIEYYAFPTISQIKSITEEDYKTLKTGFRAPYLFDCSKHLQTIDIEELSKLNYEEAKKLLMTIKGVGPKVANCVLLFSLGHTQAFPVDVWIKRIMEKLYFGQITSVEQITSFALEKYGNYGGYAQQYLFANRIN